MPSPTRTKTKNTETLTPSPCPEALQGFPGQGLCVIKLPQRLCRVEGQETTDIAKMLPILYPICEYEYSNDSNNSNHKMITDN